MEILSSPTKMQSPKTSTFSKCIKKGFVHIIMSQFNENFRIYLRMLAAVGARYRFATLSTLWRERAAKNHFNRLWWNGEKFEIILNMLTSQSLLNRDIRDTATQVQHHIIKKSKKVIMDHQKDLLVRVKRDGEWLDQNIDQPAWKKVWRYVIDYES